MNAKTNLILLALAIILVGLWLLLADPFARPPGADVQREDLFAGLAQAEPAEVTISKGEDTITLKKQDGTWVLPDAQDHPADARLIEDLQDRLRSFKADTRASTSVAKHTEYEVTDQLGTHVTVKDATGTALAEFILGRSEGLPKDLFRGQQHKLPPGFDPSKMKDPTTYIRLVGDDTVYVIRQNVGGTFPATRDRWLQRRVVDLERDDVMQLTLQRPDETLSFVRDEVGTKDDASDDTWVLEGDPPLPAMSNIVLGVLNAVCTASVDSLAEPGEGVETGLDNPQVIATVKTWQGDEVTVKLGNPEDPENPDAARYYFQVVGKDWVYLATSYLSSQLKKARTEFYNLDLASYRVSSATRIEIVDGVGEDAHRVVLTRSGDGYEAPWVVETPEGLETSKEAVDRITTKLGPSTTRASDYVLDGTAWEPGAGSRTINVTPRSWTEEPAEVETVIFADPGSAVDGKLRVRVPGREPDLLIELEKVESFLSPLETWAWVPAPEEEPVEGPEPPGEAPDVEPTTPPSDEPGTPVEEPTTPPSDEPGTPVEEPPAPPSDEPGTGDGGQSS